MNIEEMDETFLEGVFIAQFLAWYQKHSLFGTKLNNGQTDQLITEYLMYLYKKERITKMSNVSLSNVFLLIPESQPCHNCRHYAVASTGPTWTREDLIALNKLRSCLMDYPVDEQDERYNKQISEAPLSELVDELIKMDHECKLKLHEFKLKLIEVLNNLERT